MISRKRKDCASSGAEMRARLGDRIGVAAVTYVLFGVKLGPALALSLILVFAVWIGWRWLCAEMKPLIILAIVLEAFDPPPSDGKKALPGALFGRFVDLGDSIGLLQRLNALRPCH